MLTQNSPLYKGVISRRWLCGGPARSISQDILSLVSLFYFSLLPEISFLFFFKSRLLSQEAPLRLNVNGPPSCLPVARGLGVYISKSKEGMCQGKMTRRHVQEEPVKEQSPQARMGRWTAGQTGVPSLGLSELTGLREQGHKKQESPELRQ